MPCISEETLTHCSCTYTACEKCGNCYKCGAYHKARGELPGCFFSLEAERSYDRTLANLVRDRGIF